MAGTMGDTSDQMRQRYETLKSQELSGQIDENGRVELQRLRQRFEGTNSA